ncbi:MAG: division/cell wall cluster transcriptional repressor MraZ [Christensenellaceae bacterium]|nr:division/cell wall cluster transcriptional repressor MraZ [Christensenellaceae bacterium]
MTVFSGNWAHTMDAKGRVTIPASYREVLGDQFTIGLNSERSAIALFPAEHWQRIEEDLSKIPMTDARGMRYVRMISGNSFPGSQLDAQGRVLLPPTLRQRVGLEKSVRFVGVGRSLEVWDEERYQAECEAVEETSAQLLEYINDRYYGPKE